MSSVVIIKQSHIKSLDEGVISREELCWISLFGIKSTEALIRTPKRRVHLESLLVVLDCFFLFRHKLSNLTKKEKSCGAIWDFLQLLRVH